MLQCSLSLCKPRDDDDNNNNNNNNNKLLLLLLLLTAIGLSPGGSGYFTCIQNVKLVTNKFKLGGLAINQLNAQNLLL